MSIALMTRVWSSPVPAEAADRLALLALADSANDDGVCWPSMRTLARRCCVDVRTVQRTVERLEGAGFVAREFRSGRSTFYTVRPGPPPGVDATPDAGTTPGVRVTPAPGVDATPTPDAGTTPPPASTPPRTVIEPKKETTTEPPRAKPDAEADGGDVVVDVLTDGGNAKGTDAERAAKNHAYHLLTARGVTSDTAIALAAADPGQVVLVCNHADADERKGQKRAAGWIVTAVRDRWTFTTPGDGRPANVVSMPGTAAGPNRPPEAQRAMDTMQAERESPPVQTPNAARAALDALYNPAEGRRARAERTEAVRQKRRDEHAAAALEAPPLAETMRPPDPEAAARLASQLEPPAPAQAAGI